ncbi:radical SAM family heme chaperone HemW [Hymenobacter sp. BT770]|uniref:radical SAM family heme chaperone HemW n=1 Tax=Hymenobacter sp. BT770 TaxID=2886942 RepID=UPI001D121A46|nr:radical SAM family heme chaperone HemW [Hymenobacter sp. BT770]MCC3154161.1 radical SAM family heme chaperone HemW [Hymenobacter sp. BT770]MDO3414392.1 radical SAM family heme chaperone HemW [Hymenobacter sp. BT770]
MAGLYLHIPFCKQACHYCDFHFSTSLGLKSRLVDAVVREIELRRDYLGPNTALETIYFGGGTPSLLTAAELSQIFTAIHRHFAVMPGAEITLEANPDDLSAAKLHELQQASVNRLSIGLQSFYEPHLRMMNRAHTAEESTTAVRRAQDAGFENISIDLIYGVPAPGHHIWETDLANAFALGVPHVSAYALTIEPGTAFGHRLQKGTFKAAPDEFVATQFEMLLAAMRAHGYEQYEISNFCQPGRESRHNGNYWRGVPYLGLGPSAHSYDGHNRQFTLANNPQYVAAVLERGEVPVTVDTLTATDRANEYLLTTLRTARGCDLAHLRTAHGFDLLATRADYLAELQANGWARISGEVLTLTDAGKLLADHITLELFQTPAVAA